MWGRGLGVDLPFDLPEFRARPPWWGADLQTLRNVLAPPRLDFSSYPAVRLELPLTDGSGDALSALLQEPVDPRRPLVVLIHGLSGSEESAYMGATASYLLGLGHPVLRLNLRGAGASRSLCRLQYHAGRTEDLRDALGSLEPRLVSPGLLLVGYSLGGNMLLKFLAEHASAFPVHAGVSVSAPIDLAAASRRFLAPRNRLYHRHVLRNMKRESLAPGAEASNAERRCIRAARSIYEFDATFVAPRNGYASAEDYYADNMALRFLDGIRVPTLLIQALDDPWIPAATYADYPWHGNRGLLPLLAEGGGHVGFHARDSDVAWHDRALGAFFENFAPS